MRMILTTTAQPLQVESVIVPGGSTPGTATNLGTYIANNPSATLFILQSGYYASVNITRGGITILSEVPGGARFEQRTVTVSAPNVTVDGLTIIAAGTPLEIFSPGVIARNNRISGFGRTTYGNGILVHKSALVPTNRVIIQGNMLDDWGDYQFAGGIAVGAAIDTIVSELVTVEVRDNIITNGPTQIGVMSAGIQSFHPFICSGNFIDTVSGSAIQNKTRNSHIYCNIAANIVGDGALYNRLDSNNTWEYNIVRDSFMGLDHFMGNGVVFRGNIIHNCDYLGRIKDQGMGTNNLAIENNTFYVSGGWAGFIWDTATGQATIQNVVWRRNIFQACPNGGSAIADSSVADWDEYENIFWQTNRPTGTTGFITGSSIVVNPNFVSPPTDFTPQAPQAQGRGAPWPRPCQ